MILQTVEVMTTLGAVYRFPDVAHADVDRAMKDMRGALFGSFTLTNLSGAAIVVPLKIIQQISYGEVVLWQRADSPA